MTNFALMFKSDINFSVTLGLVIVNVLFSLAAFNNQSLMQRFNFNPYTIQHRKEWWRFITHAFLHADYMHLAFNMLALYSFGNVVEQHIFAPLFHEKAKLYFLALYFGGMLVSVIPTFEKHKKDIWYNAVGASGAVSAVVFCFIVFFPLEEIRVFFFPIPAVVFAVLYTIYSFYAGRKGTDNVNHSAHLSGAAFGILFTLATYPKSAQIFLNQIQSAF